MANEWNVEIKDSAADAATYIETLDSTVLMHFVSYTQNGKTKFMIASAT